MSNASRYEPSYEFDESPLNPPSNDFLPTTSLATLQLRDNLLRRIRAFFHSRDFLEVTTPTLSRDTVVDRHLHPFVARPLGGDANSEAVWYLQTSPEYLMKRLLAGGAEAIFQICPAYRVGEIGPLHNPEFTMLEWYRCGDDMHAGIALLSELIDKTFDLGATRTVAYRAVFQQYVDIDPFTSELATLRGAIAATETLTHQGPDPLGLDRDGCLEWLFLDRVQPNLRLPTIVCDYPASQAALAQVRHVSGEAPVAERFELFAAGIELANGYHELLDPDELVRRNIENNRQRVVDGNAALPEASRLLKAMQYGLPDCTGVALGFDRLTMLALNCPTIDEILAFPFTRA